jgi:hypothetical protein
MNVTDGRSRALPSFADALRWSSAVIDILVSNAGLASSAPIEDTTLALWDKNIDILATGYFLVSAARPSAIFRNAGQAGGNVVFVASKNGLAASPNGASAYCTAKAAEVHLARCLALEGADPRRSASTSSTRMPCCAARRSGPASGRSSAPPSYNTDVDRRAGGACTATRSMLKRSASSRRTLPRRSTSSPQTCRPSRPATFINVDAVTPNAFTR